MDKIGGMGKRLLENAPSEAVIGNITRIILKMIRDEYASLHKGKHEESELQDSLQKFLMDDQADFDYTADTPLLEEGVIDRIKEYMTELETRLLFHHQIIEVCLSDNMVSLLNLCLLLF